MDNSRRARIEKNLRYVEDEVQRSLHAERQRLLLDVANLQGQDAISWFRNNWRRLWPETPQDMIELRDELREVWEWDREFSERFASGDIDWRAALDAPSAAPPDYFLNKWLSWRPTAEQEEARKSLDLDRFLAVADSPLGRSIFGRRVDVLPVGLLSIQSWSDVAAPFHCSLYSRRLLPKADNLRAMLVQGVLEHWGRLKYCTNTHCLSPYFIARRKDQTVCDAEICKAEKQREHARKWWNENRARKAQDETNTGSNTAKKGRKGNVTRKAR